MELPNPQHLWQWGVSLGVYSERGRVLTTRGDMINRYKYRPFLSKAHRAAIEREFSDQVWTLLKENFREKYQDVEDMPFDVCLGPPETRGTRKSLPREVCRSLAARQPWMVNGFEGIRKTRESRVVKDISRKERTAHLAGLYEVNPETMPYSNFGFLVIDDVFDTGSTVTALCETLRGRYAEAPIYVVALTHLAHTEGPSS